MENGYVTFFCKFSESLPSTFQIDLPIGKPLFVQFDQERRCDPEQRFLVGEYSNTPCPFFQLPVLKFHHICCPELPTRIQ